MQKKAFIILPSAFILLSSARLDTASQTTALALELSASRFVINNTSSSLNGSWSEEVSEITLAS